MKTLSEAACSAWLAERGIAESPYGSPQSEQFPLPPEASRSASLIRQIIASTAPFGSALLQFTDWPLYELDEMAIVNSLRGEHGRLIDTPGHVFFSEQTDLLAGMFSLAAFYHWNAYLYFDCGVVIHCWEGDLLDLWVADSARLEAMRAIFAAHRLSSTLAASPA